MKKILVCFTVFIMMFGIISCDNNSNDTNQVTTNDLTMLLEEYNLPNNFAITIQISDTAIHNPGNPWYYKTARIGNDWQIIKFDRDLADLSKQETHFYKYLDKDNYEHYIYNYDNSNWDKLVNVCFKELYDNNLNNFLFLYEKPLEVQIEVNESEVTYDIDSTSIENFIPAIKYSYKDYFDIDVMVDKEFINMSLSMMEKDGSLICTYWKAYDYSKSISSWDNTYLLAKNYKLF